MDQRSICLFLALKGLSGRAVSDELAAVLGRADAIASSTVTKYLPQRQLASILVDSPPRNQRQPSSFIRELARFTCIPTTTAHRHLTQSLGFVVKHHHWVLHTITPTQKTERATLSIEPLRRLRSIEHHGWQFIITLDESWFYFSRDDERIWLHVEKQPLERPRHTI
jgi:hypothetical protein